MPNALCRRTLRLLFVGRRSFFTCAYPKCFPPPVLLIPREGFPVQSHPHCGIPAVDFAPPRQAFSLDPPSHLPCCGGFHDTRSVGRYASEEVTLESRSLGKLRTLGKCAGGERDCNVCENVSDTLSCAVRLIFLSFIWCPCVHPSGFTGSPCLYHVLTASRC